MPLGDWEPSTKEQVLQQWQFGTFADNGNRAMLVTECYRVDLNAVEYVAQWPDGCEVHKLVPSELLGFTYFNLDDLKRDVRNELEADHVAMHRRWVTEPVRGEDVVVVPAPTVRRYCALEG